MFRSSLSLGLKSGDFADAQPPASSLALPQDNIPTQEKLNFVFYRIVVTLLFIMRDRHSYTALMQIVGKLQL